MSENEKETGASAPRKRPSGLGRGLNALFGDAAVEAPVLATPGAAAKAVGSCSSKKAIASVAASRCAPTMVNSGRGGKSQ